MSKWYHGTSKKNADSIRINGFQTPSDYGIWGTGTYLTKSKEEANTYGEEVLTVYVNDSEIIELDYQSYIVNLFPDLSAEEEEGTPRLQEYILTANKKGVVVKYSANDCNLILYDTTGITL